MIYLYLFWTFFKIGIVSFGGGYAMIPLMNDEVVVNWGWLEESRFLELIAVSESTPGPFAINMATFVGATQGGIIGSLCATLGVVLPSFIIILLIASIITGLLKIAGVKAALEAIKPVVIGLIIGTGITLFLSTIFAIKTIKSTFYFDYKALIIFFIVAGVAYGYKKWKKKKISPIILIIISALLGMLLYGVF